MIKKGCESSCKYDTTLYITLYNKVNSQPSIFELLSKYKNRGVTGSISLAL
jgi:hypothetical protein